MRLYVLLFFLCFFYTLNTREEQQRGLHAHHAVCFTDWICLEVLFVLCFTSLHPAAFFHHSAPKWRIHSKHTWIRKEKEKKERKKEQTRFITSHHLCCICNLLKPPKQKTILITPHFVNWEETWNLRYGLCREEAKCYSVLQVNRRGIGACEVLPSPEPIQSTFLLPANWVEGRLIAELCLYGLVALCLQQESP